MIRKRIPALDDRTIYRLVTEELLPYTRQFAPGTRISRNQIRTRLNRGVTWVAAADSQSRGCGFIHILHKERKLFVDMLAISRRHQGQGIGGRLMNQAEGYGRMRGCRRSMLYVDSTNQRAFEFYQKRGYAVDYFDPAIHCYLMSKDL